MGVKYMYFVASDPTADPMGATHRTSREQEIAKLAYAKAQARGFAPGQELEDWLAAEQELDAGSVSGMFGR